MRQLSAEIEALAEKGKIKDEYIRSEDGMDCFQELLNAIDDVGMDSKRCSYFLEDITSVTWKEEGGNFALVLKGSTRGNSRISKRFLENENQLYIRNGKDWMEVRPE